MSINVETQTVELKTTRLSKYGNTYTAKVYKAGTLPQDIADKYPNDVEVIVDVDTIPVEKVGGVVTVGEKVIISAEAIPLSEPELPEQKVFEKTPKAKIASKTSVVNPAE